MTRRRILGPILGAAVSVAFLVLALVKVPLNQAAAAIRSADYRLVALAALFTLASYVFRTGRWSRLLAPSKRIPAARLFPVLIIGFALNNIFPGRPGEFARAISLGQREGLSKTLGLATVVFERVVDGITLIAVLLLVSLGLDLPGWGRQAELVSIALFVAALSVLVLLLWQQELAGRLLHQATGVLSNPLAARVGRMFDSFVLGLHSLRSPRDVLMIACLSFAAWACEGIHYLLILSAFGLVPVISDRMVAAAFTLVMVNLSVAIPAAPGGVGPFEWAGGLALGIFGVPLERAVPAVLLAHTIQYVLVTGLGLVLTQREGVRLTQAVSPADGE